RWLGQDPLGFDAGDSNLYRYVHNAPLNYTDPSGADGEPGDDLRRFLQGQDRPPKHPWPQRLRTPEAAETAADWVVMGGAAGGRPCLIKVGNGLAGAPDGRDKYRWIPYAGPAGPRPLSLDEELAEAMQQPDAMKRWVVLERMRQAAEVASP